MADRRSEDALERAKTHPVRPSEASRRPAAAPGRAVGTLKTLALVIGVKGYM